MNNERLLEIQAKRSTQKRKGDAVQKSVEQVVNDCRRYIQDHSESYKHKQGEEKTNAISKLIVQYVRDTNPTVEGYVDMDGNSDTNELVRRIVQDITDYGILSNAMADPDVYEIRCNGKTIKVEIKGRVKDYVDANGNYIDFESVEQQQIIMRKLLGDVRLTPKDAVVNARTIEGYRVAAVHPVGLSSDPINPANDGYAAFVLRKFKKNKMNLGDIVKYKTLSDNMARFLALTMAGGLTFFTVGPTASGKTTSNQGILQAVPPTTRVVLLQNPSEIDLRMRDVTGRIYNDVLHLEAQEIEKPLPTSPTMENLQNHILRLSPTFVCFGELRSNIEFFRGLQIGQAGHPFNCTFHAENSEGALLRFAEACGSASGSGKESALDTIAKIVNIIVVQKIMKDGTRKILQISEVLGSKDGVPLINDLYKFITDGEPETDSMGNTINIYGHHKRVGKLTARSVEKLKLEGVSTKRFSFLLDDPKDDEVETYIGDNEDIIHYGLH